MFYGQIFRHRHLVATASLSPFKTNPSFDLVVDGEKMEKHWCSLEREGNIGIDFIINPYLYKEIADFLCENPESKIVDFGAGTNMLAIQFMYGNSPDIPALESIKNIAQARKNIDSFIGLEGSEQLVAKAREQLGELGHPGNIDIRHFEVRHGRRKPFGDSSIALAISRNFVMHLEKSDLEYHVSEISRILKSDGKSIIAFLNPSYEQKKHLDLSPHNKPLQTNEKYSFVHGSHGEHGVFAHYWKDIDTYEKIFDKHLKIINRVECFPITDRFREKYHRYYQKDLPMALVYVLAKRQGLDHESLLPPDRQSARYIAGDTVMR
ncbi:class I SAM-dependent methyltransferase [Azotobacter vinelandii]|uniref:class I SAM-dependent methyltransferase n=1 Tax=Azotobacter vinelandii TaxID=354 RepID=UPI001E392303|nr:class I SAM-dependent methyltransferase [Azotobacter vinelandii]